MCKRQPARAIHSHFNPRTPLQSAIGQTVCGRNQGDISIHALHYRVRYDFFGQSKRACHFNPRTPLQSAMWSQGTTDTPVDYFNPRTPLQSAMNRLLIALAKSLVFQSTHSITECDWADERIRTFGGNFNPRTPLQSAMWAWLSGNCNLPLFQSTHSITECDKEQMVSGATPMTFQSTHSITECDRYGRRPDSR